MLKNKVLAALKVCYRHLPMGEKIRAQMKDEFYTIFAFALKDTQMYRLWRSTKYGPEDVDLEGLVQKRGVLRKQQREQPGKIAIQLHLFYIDLVDDFCRYLGNMPFDFDLLLSIVDGDKKEFVEERFRQVRRLEHCIVRVVPNRGRDVAPFLVGFGDLLDRYDFIAHIHSKKSLYTGAEQAKWRNYLLDGLLGSRKWIRKLFAAFVENPRLGVLYPKPAPNVPYAAYTWLSNRRIGMELLARLQVPPPLAEYFDFPAGTMLWARPKAIRRLYTSGISMEDFPVEDGQLDGTIAHAVERSFALLAMAEGMDYYEVDAVKGEYTVNGGTKNLWQYIPRTETNLEFHMGFPVVSFAILGTLAMRKIYGQAFLHELVGLEMEKRWGMRIDVRDCLGRAEEAARRKLPQGKDCSMDDIYREVAALPGLPENAAGRMRDLEMELELRLAAPRSTMVRWLQEYRRAGKRILLVADTCRNREEIGRILSQCGIEGYDEMYLSSETGLRKDTGDLWKKFIADGMTEKLIHIGDNETADCQRPGDLKLHIYHVLSPANLFALTNFGRNFLRSYGKDLGLWGAALLGVFLWRRFQDPFVFHENDGAPKLKGYDEIGYVIYGPVFLTYTCWLFRELQGGKGKDHFLQSFHASVEKACAPGEFAGESREAAKALFSGMRDFCRDVLDAYGEMLPDIPVDPDFAEAWLQCAAADRGLLDKSMRGFCGILRK